MSKEDSWISTYTGLQFHPYNPDVFEIDSIDIAHALSLSCRYGGHTETFYSVAQHSLNTTHILAELGYGIKLQLYALLHDASEAYITDLPRPFKMFLDDYKEIEKNIQSVIWKRFGLDEPTEKEYEIIKAADNEMLYWEANTLIKANDWITDFKSLDIEFDEKLIQEKPFKEVEKEFLDKLYKLLVEYHTWGVMNLKNEIKSLEDAYRELLNEYEIFRNEK